MALASHRAVYDLKLSSTRGKRAMNAVRGRILYDFSGSACEGYALQFRQVSELDSGEGKVIVSAICAPPRGRRAPASGCGFIRRTTSTKRCATRSTARPSETATASRWS